MPTSQRGDPPLGKYSKGPSGTSKSTGRHGLDSTQIRIAWISAGSVIVAALITAVSAFASGWLQYRGPGAALHAGPTVTVTATPRVTVTVTPAQAGPAPAGSGSAATTWLTDLQPSTSDLLDGRWSIGNSSYGHSMALVRCPGAGTGSGSVTYMLNGQRVSLQATFGVTNDTPAGDQVTLQVSANGNTVATRQAALNSPASVDIPLGNVRQLTLTFNADCFATAVLGDVRLVS
jgi:hypothetical protein